MAGKSDFPSRKPEGARALSGPLWPLRKRSFAAISLMTFVFASLCPHASEAGNFSLNWGTAPYTWTTNATGPVTITMTDQYGFQLGARMTIARIGGAAVAGYPDDLAGFGTNTSIWLVWDANNGSGSVGESTNTATLEFLNGGVAFAPNSVQFQITDIDSTDNNAAGDRCDFVSVTGNAGNPVLSYVHATASQRTVRIGVQSGSGATGTLAANQAQCIYNTGATTSPTSNADNFGSILAVFPSGTHTATVAYDESIENVYGVTSRNADARGIGVWGGSSVVVNNSISLTKSTVSTSYTSSGQVITYTYIITNNGPLPINTGQNIQIQDSKIGTFTCGTIAAAIPSGGTHSCTANYTITAGDASAANVTNDAVAGVGTGTQTFATRLQSNTAQVVLPNHIIVANDVNFTSSPINGASGGATSTVFVNDTLGGTPFANGDVIATIDNNGGLTGATINADGTITVPPGTTSATYNVTYRICEVAAPANCDTAIAAVLVSVSPPVGGTSCTGTNLANNGGFESPVVAPATVTQQNPGLVPGWSTTDTSIEFWGTGFNGVPAHTGNAFSELNANIAGTLTQTTGAIHPRAELRIYWAHRARQGSDTASLTINDNGGGSTSFGNFTSTTAAWIVRTTTHVATTTASSSTLAFTAVSTGSGNISVGNFLDTVEVCQTYLTLDKSEASRTDVDSSGGDSDGDTITYSYAIANPAGNNSAVASVSIADDKLGVIAVGSPASGDTNTNGFLDPGETWIVNANYTLTQADLDSGSVTNIASVSASTGANTISTADDTVTATFATTPALTIAKTADATALAGNLVAGQTVTYTYVVTNTGNVTIDNVTIADAHDGSDPDPAPSGEVVSTDVAPLGDSTDSDGVNGNWTALAPGDSITFQATYTVTQADVDSL